MGKLAGTLSVETFDSPASWAAKKRRLGNDSAQAGLFDPNLTPYLNDAYKAFIDPTVRKITICCGAQMGKTDFLLNLAGYSLDITPKTIMVVEPTQKLAESISNDRFKKMAASVGLRPEGKPKVSEKHYNGTKIIFAWASSASQLCSHPVCVILMDELNQMKTNVDGQGSPYTLAEARTTTYPNSVIVTASTPTLAEFSAINKLYETATTYKWAVPHKECGNLVIPSFSSFRWTEIDGVCTDAWIECPHCRKELREIDNAHGEHILTKKGPPDHVGYWISGLVSPFRTLKQAGQRYLDAINDSEETLKTCINTVFGETYALRTEKIDALSIELNKQFCPKEKGIIYTLGVDVQQDSLYYVVRGWRKDESWQVAYNQILGYTDCNEVWSAVEDIIGRYSISLAAIDSGYNTPVVYSFCDRNRGRAIPCKGRQTMEVPIKERDRNQKYGYDPRQSKLFLFDDTYFKNILFSRIKAGVFHTLPTITTDYIEQLTSEELQQKSNKWIWVQVKDDNHYLDCEKLTILANEVLKHHKINQQVAKNRAIIDLGVK